MAKRILGRRGPVCHTCPGHSQSLREVRARTQVGNLEAGTEVESIDKHCIGWLPQSANSTCFLIQLRAICPGLVPPTRTMALSCCSPRKYPTGLPTDQSDGDISSTVTFFPEVKLTKCIKLTKIRTKPNESTRGKGSSDSQNSYFFKKPHLVTHTHL